jgi:3-(3-hydroxy-phenyl)propionate hydroxylase
MTEHAVVVAGGGPTGLMLAGELALAGTDIVVVERRTSQVLEGSRSGGLQARTIEVLDQRGIAERFLEAGEAMQVNAYGPEMPLDISDFPSRHPYGLALWQSHFERILAEWVFDELNVPVLRGREVTGLTQDDGGVDVELADGAILRAAYVVGCDGGRSIVRKAAGIDFPGLEPTTSWIVAEVEMDEEPEWGFRRDGAGHHAIGRRQDDEPIRLVTTERSVREGEPSTGELRDALVAVYGSDFGLRSVSWISRFTDASRQAASYRAGRVLVAGDAAHVHPPQGGQGLNTGVQDAVNLGWKLAQVVKGTSPETLLDTYHAERHPVGARVLRHTSAQVALGKPDERHAALRADIAEMVTADETRRQFGGLLSGLSIHYDLGEGHPLLGRRMPDLELGTVRVYELLHDGRGVLLNFGSPWALDPAPWSDRVQALDAHYDGEWDLPVLGTVAAPAGALVRPDGHVAWVGDGTDAGLRDALTRWFGPR